MPSLEVMRNAIRQHIEDDGRIIQSQIPDNISLMGSVGNIVSLSPARVELLSGKVVEVRAYTGPVPSLGETVFMIRLNRWWIALTGMTVV